MFRITLPDMPKSMSRDYEKVMSVEDKRPWKIDNHTPVLVYLNIQDLSVENEITSITDTFNYTDLDHSMATTRTSTVKASSKESNRGSKAKSQKTSRKGEKKPNHKSKADNILPLNTVSKYKILLSVSNHDESECTDTGSVIAKSNVEVNIHVPPIDTYDSKTDKTIKRQSKKLNADCKSKRHSKETISTLSDPDVICNRGSSDERTRNTQTNKNVCALPDNVNNERDNTKEDCKLYKDAQTSINDNGNVNEKMLSDSITGKTQTDRVCTLDNKHSAHTLNHKLFKKDLPGLKITTEINPFQSDFYPNCFNNRASPVRDKCDTKASFITLKSINSQKEISKKANNMSPTCQNSTNPNLMTGFKCECEACNVKTLVNKFDETFDRIISENLLSKKKKAEQNYNFNLGKINLNTRNTCEVVLGKPVEDTGNISHEYEVLNRRPTHDPKIRKYKTEKYELNTSNKTFEVTSITNSSSLTKQLAKEDIDQTYKAVQNEWPKESAHLPNVVEEKGYTNTQKIYAGTKEIKKILAWKNNNHIKTGHEATQKLNIKRKKEQKKSPKHNRSSKQHANAKAFAQYETVNNQYYTRNINYSVPETAHSAGYLKYEHSGDINNMKQEEMIDLKQRQQQYLGAYYRNARKHLDAQFIQTFERSNMSAACYPNNYIPNQPPQQVFQTKNAESYLPATTLYNTSQYTNEMPPYGNPNPVTQSVYQSKNAERNMPATNCYNTLEYANGLHTHVNQTRTSTNERPPFVNQTSTYANEFEYVNHAGPLPYPPRPFCVQPCPDIGSPATMLPLCIDNLNQRVRRTEHHLDAAYDVGQKRPFYYDGIGDMKTMPDQKKFKTS